MCRALPHRVRVPVKQIVLATESRPRARGRRTGVRARGSVCPGSVRAFVQVHQLVATAVLQSIRPPRGRSRSRARVYVEYDQEFGIRACARGSTREFRVPGDTSLFFFFLNFNAQGEAAAGLLLQHWTCRPYISLCRTIDREAGLLTD